MCWRRSKMAGALSENAPRPVSVVTVDGASVQPHSTPRQQNRNDMNTNQQQDLLSGPNVTQANDLQGRNDENQSENQTIVQQVDSRITQRSFASTEAQTELAVGSRLLENPGLLNHHHHHHHHSQLNNQANPNENHVHSAEDQLRDARRRERRVRRHHRRAMRSCSMPPTYQGVVTSGACIGSVAGANPIAGHAGVPLVPPVGGFLHPPPPHLGLRGLSLGLPFPVPASVSAFGRSVDSHYMPFKFASIQLNENHRIPNFLDFYKSANISSKI